MSRHALAPLEPLGDRPAVWSPFGDVWQRFGPIGTGSWWSAQPDGSYRGLTWPELLDLCGEGAAPIPIERPLLPDLAYTTDSIPVVQL